jgi:hypothetical protein
MPKGYLRNVINEGYATRYATDTPKFMHPGSIQLEGGVTVSIDKGVKSAYQDSANTVRLLTPRLGGGGIGGASKVGVVKLTFSSPIVSIK